LKRTPSIMMSAISQEEDIVGPELTATDVLQRYKWDLQKKNTPNPYLGKSLDEIIKILKEKGYA